MNAPSSDHRLTAYALGELDPAERDAFERDLAGSPELQAELTALTPLCDDLMKTLTDPADTLTAAQRDDLRARLTAEPPRRRYAPILLGALAASVAVALGVWGLTRPDANKPARLALSPTSPPASETNSATREPSVVVASRNEAPAPLVTKEYTVFSAFLSRLNAPAEKAPAEPDSGPPKKSRAKESLLALGVTFPPGASANYLPASGKLVVRNTATNLDLIEKLEVASAKSLSAAPGTNAEVQRLLTEAEGFYTRGSYDLAFKRANEALTIDRYNIPARRLIEKTNVARGNYAQNAMVENETRSRRLWEVSKSWQMPVRRYVGGKDLAATDSSPQQNAASSAPEGSAPLSTGTRTASASGGMPVTILPTSSGATAKVEFPESTEARPNEATLASDWEPEIASADKSRGKAELVGGVAGARTLSGRSFALRLNYGLQSAEYQIQIGSEAYAAVAGNIFQSAATVPLSTFSIDVDTASYANIRRFLNDGQLPPTDAVRLEELINYFPYALPQPEGDAPFSVTTEVSHAPWNEQHLLARVALQGRDIAADKLPPSNLVFLVDVSGSMRPENKLPLLKRSLRELVQRLAPRDRVAIVVYAGSSGLALPSTSGEDQPRILEAIDRLEAGGSTNGASGIQLAYDLARENFRKEGNNRVILCTDGDFNVGVTSQEELTRLIERERKSGVFLSVLGFGTGNLKDATMENLADKGNGNYAYIDSPSEGRKVLVEQMGATLFTIAKDVKIQVEFNPATVAGYRLIGYENRLLAKEDFNDDTKDAGEIGAGHTVTALYEIVPAGQPLPNDRTVDALKYQEPTSGNPKSKIQNPKSTDLFTVKLRFKAPNSDTSKLLEKVVSPDATAFDRASDDFRFASAVAAFGMKLRADPNDATMEWNAIQKIARGSLGEDPGTSRAEFLTLIEKAKQLREGSEE